VATGWAAKVFPTRILKGDTKFLATWSFLFFRYSTGAYWYGPVVLIRNALVAVAPIFIYAVHQILFLELLLIASLVMLLIVMPWRVLPANYLDTMGHVCMLCVTMVAAFFVEDKDSELRLVSTISAIGIMIIPFVLVAGIIYGVVRLLQMRLKPYQFFLCHHKAAAGSFCRFMKMRLAKTSGVKTKVFIDTDDLRNLDGLFDVVAHKTGTLVVIQSRSVLLRPWCAGEITTAFRSSVRTVSVFIHGVPGPTDEFIAKYGTHVPDLSTLTEFGILLEHIQEAFSWLTQQAAIYLPAEAREPAIDEVCTTLVNDLKNAGDSRTIDKRVENMPAKLRLLLLADEQDLEAISTALILRHLLIPLTVHLDRATGFLWSPGQEIRPMVEKAALVLTNGVFNEAIVGAVRKLTELKASILPIMSTTNFQFPSTHWLARQNYIMEMEEEKAAATIRMIKNIFTEIAVDFQPSALSGTEATLDIKAEEIVLRLFGDADGTVTTNMRSARSESRLALGSTMASSRSLFGATFSSTSSRMLSAHMSSTRSQISHQRTGGSNKPGNFSPQTPLSPQLSAQMVGATNCPWSPGSVPSSSRWDSASGNVGNFQKIAEAKYSSRDSRESRTSDDRSSERVSDVKEGIKEEEVDEELGLGAEHMPKGIVVPPRPPDEESDEEDLDKIKILDLDTEPPLAFLHV